MDAENRHMDSVVAAEPLQPLAKAVFGLEQLYTVLNGFALTSAVDPIAREWLDPERPFPTAHVLLLAGLLATLIPFTHGAWQHLKVTHLEPTQPRNTSGVFLVDYLLLMIEGLLFIFLAFAVPVTSRFLQLTMLLFAVDVLFVVGTYASLRKRGFVRELVAVARWGLLNVLFFGVIGPLWWFRDEPWAPWVLMMALVIRTCIDYGWNWDYYFPPRLNEGPRPVVLP